jgi:hypothetical protein
MISVRKKGAKSLGWAGLLFRKSLRPRELPEFLLKKGVEPIVETFDL